MTELMAILWFIMLLLSVAAVFNFIGSALMVQFFPEGRRWWQLPAQLLSLAFFGAMVLLNPFWGPMA